MAEKQNITLADVDQAIKIVMSGGQRYRIGSRELQRASLSDLLALRQTLAGADDAADSAPLLPGACVAVFDRR